MNKKTYSSWSELEYAKLKEMGIVGPVEFALKRKTMQIIKSISMNEGERIIDVGCGSGDLLKEGWIGLDVDREPLAKIQNTCVQGDICHLPFVEGAFDKVVASYCLEHVEEDMLAIQEIYRILRKDGIALIEVPYNPRLWSAKDELCRHFRRYDDAFIDTVKGCGFKILKKRLYGRGLLYYYWNIRNKLSSTDSGLYLPPSWLLKLIRLSSPIINRILYYGMYLPFGTKLFLSCVAQKA
ncbi:MAG: class I SAM-dependent methyltransferase [Methanocellales archaeon]|nr:class I SAM-dependent methyltransferase [Methanocellales archaeon]